jgi:hypothetical protein
VPDGTLFGIGSEFEVSLKVNTEEEAINASEAIINFPNDKLELLSVSRSNSVFNFWVEDPAINNDNGSMKFIGGTPKGIAGGALHILTMKFKTKGAGSADISISNAAVTASDGKGTNVLSKVEGASVGVGTQVVAPKPISIPSPTAQEPAKQPEPIARTAVRATGLPPQPQLEVPLYPSPIEWYNHIGDVVVFWDVPDDITKIATKVNKNPNSEPTDVEDQLFNGKSFGVLEEGIWYIHVQFRNNIGWGPIVHYRIAIDTVAPLSFEIETNSADTENPTPELRFQAFDALSGISHYLIYIDDKDPIRATSTAITLAPQAPGPHTIVVRAVDKAGNSVEDDIEINIIPLSTPRINFFSKSASQGELIFVSGESLPRSFVDIHFFDKNNQEVFVTAVNSDEDGNWEAIIEEPLPQGRYTFVVNARNDRGALSYPTDPQTIKIRAKTILSIGPLDLGLFEILLIVILLAGAIGGGAGWYYVKERKTREAYKTMAGRDIDKLSDLLANDLNELDGIYNQQAVDDRTKPQTDRLFSRLKDNIAKMKKYLRQELDRLE